MSQFSCRMFWMVVTAFKVAPPNANRCRRCIYFCRALFCIYLCTIDCQPTDSHEHLSGIKPHQPTPPNLYTCSCIWCSPCILMAVVLHEFVSHVIKEGLCDGYSCVGGTRERPWTDRSHSWICKHICMRVLFIKWCFSLSSSIILEIETRVGLLLNLWFKQNKHMW